MKKSTLLFCLFFVCFIASSHAASINFMKGDLEQLKIVAAQENKPFFVSFTASWCLPCRQMEKTTYTDPHLAYYVSKYYLAAKVDVDDFDGYNYKVQYNIQRMPTLMIFNPQGEVIARFEQSMSASTMKSILDKYNKPYKKQTVQVKPPQPVIVTTTTTTRPSSYTTTITRPALKPSKQKTSNTSNYFSPTRTNARPVATGQGLYKLSILNHRSNGYSVQLGMFEDYDNLLAEASRLDKMLKKQVLVHVDWLKGKKVYKVMVGEFKTKERAIVYRNQLKQKGLTGFIRNLSLMK